MTVDYFTYKYGYEAEGIWMPRVTAITSLVSRSFLFGGKSSADWGTLIHSAVETTLKGEKVKDPRITPSLKAFEKWRTANLVKIQDPARDIESRIYDFENGYAGTVDMVASVKERIGVIDLKTASMMREEYGLQTAAYLNAYNRGVQKKLQAETRWILRLDQYQECKGCLARKRERDKTGKAFGGNAWCNHQWSPSKGEAEFLELDNFERDFEAFLAAKEVWEWYHRAMLKRVHNYPKNISQKVLI